jgi:hypothetical protein
MTSMPGVSMIEWSGNDQIGSSSKQVISDGGLPEITHLLFVCCPRIRTGNIAHGIYAKIPNTSDITHSVP